jgi:hypothetical protein
MLVMMPVIANDRRSPVSWDRRSPGIDRLRPTIEATRPTTPKNGIQPVTSPTMPHTMPARAMPLPTRRPGDPAAPVGLGSPGGRRPAGPATGST